MRSWLARRRKSWRYKLASVNFKLEQKEKIMAVVIEQDDCIACGSCVDTCPVGAIVESGEKYDINDDCTECQACLDSCPTDAIKAS